MNKKEFERLYKEFQEERKFIQRASARCFMEVQAVKPYLTQLERYRLYFSEDVRTRLREFLSNTPWNFHLGNTPCIRMVPQFSHAGYVQWSLSRFGKEKHFQLFRHSYRAKFEQDFRRVTLPKYLCFLVEINQSDQVAVTPEMGGLDKPCGDLIAPFWLEISAAKKKREASISLLSRTHIG